MGLKLDFRPGQTPLSEEERGGLKIKSITTRQELDEFEQKNIEIAVEWSDRQPCSLNNFLTEKFVKKLHQKMLGQVWQWAGQFRLSDKSIGIDARLIPVALRQLLDDCRYWLDNKVFSEEEIAIRLSHGLVKIHPFVNGNGRHSRLMADIMMVHIFKRPLFSWGGLNLEEINSERSFYIKALKKADEGDFSALLFFAKTGS